MMSAMQGGRITRSLVALLVAGSMSGTARAQYNDWERAEDEAVGEHAEDATQATELVAPPDEGAHAERGRPRDLASEEGGEQASSDGELHDEEDEGGEEGDTTSGGDAFGTLEAGGAFHLYGDATTFIGPVDVLGLGATGTIGRADAFAISPWVGARYAVTDRVSVGAEWGFSLLAHGDVQGPAPMDGGAVFRFGNPLVYGRWMPSSAQGDVVWGIDVGVAFPVASVGSGTEVLAYQLAIGSRGAWDLHLFTPDAMPIVGGLFVELAPFEGFLVRGEADVAILVDVGSTLDGAKLTLQGGLDASYRFVESFALGARVAGVFAGDVLPNRESFQLSVAPYAKLFFDPLYLAAELVLNLTEPYGVSFREAKYYGIRVLAGVTL